MHFREFRVLKKIAQKSIIFLLVSVLLSAPLFYQTAHAAGLTALSDTMSRLADTTLSNHDIKYRTPTGMSAGTMKIYFNTAGFDDGSVDYTDIDLQYGSSQVEVNDDCSSSCTKATLAAAAGAGAWGAAFASNDLTFSYPTSGGTAISANDYVRVLIGTNATEGGAGDQQMTNPGSTGTKTITIDVGTGPLDTGQLAIVIIGDDQVVVSTTIDPYLNFTLTTNAVTLTKSGGGNPDYSNTGYNQGAANTLAANTNAASGYTLTYSGATLSDGLGHDITAIGGSPAASTTSSEQFGINLKDNATPNTGAERSGAGSATAAADYGTADQFAFETGGPTTLASASASTASNTFTVSYIANVSETTEAGAYSTTITYICTGNF